MYKLYISDSEKLRNNTLSKGLAHSTVHNNLRQLYVHLQSGALIFISELPGVILLFTNKAFIIGQKVAGILRLTRVNTILLNFTSTAQ